MKLEGTVEGRSVDFVLLLYPKHCLNQPGSQGDNIRGSNEYNRNKSVIYLADQIKNVG